MSALRDTSRFVVLASLLGVGYLLVVEGENFGDRWVAVLAFALGVLAIVALAYRFREDFEKEE